jgi:hypothetical protein
VKKIALLKKDPQRFDTMKKLSSNGQSCTRALKIVFIFIMVVLIMNGVLWRNREANGNDLPFYPGEKLTFELKWGFIPAGRATLEVLPVETVNNVQVQHFVLTARTNSFVDIFYKVRERIDAYTDVGMNHSILYKEVHLVNKTRRDAAINFDWEKDKAQYTNFGQKNPPIELIPGSFDPLSIFYYARQLELQENLEIERPVTDGKKCVIGKAKVVKREKIKLRMGTFDTYLMEPDLKEVGGVFKKSKNAKIRLWVTADSRRIPVKIKSKVVVGSFSGEIIELE